LKRHVHATRLFIVFGSASFIHLEISGILEFWNFGVSQAP